MPAISTKDYAVGDLICSELPFVNVVQKDVKSKYCDNCLCRSSKTVSLKKCSGCMNMHYCSKSCQKEDWKAGHKYECKYYKRHYSDLEDDDPRLCLRLYLLLNNQKDLASRKVNLHVTLATRNFDRKFDYDKMERLEMEMNMAEHMNQQWEKAFHAGRKLIPLYKHLGATTSPSPGI
ncbi:hypothetical protein TYRP_023622 [Tyrophagus putrescentiae]|nr:hypothetical protein TYRP_023622 [Tyrophagus putrescentiae]